MPLMPEKTILLLVSRGRFFSGIKLGNLLQSTVLILVLLLMMSLNVLASESPPSTSPAPSLGADMDWMSRYVWRGVAYSDQPVFQPSVWASFGRLKFSTWFNVNLGPEENLAVPDGVSEIDPSVTYAFDLAGFVVEPSAVLYLYPDSEYDVSTGEMALSLQRQFGSLTLQSKHQWDFIQYQGAYFGQLSAMTQFKVHQVEFFTSLLLGVASAGFNSAYFDEDKWAFNLVQADVHAWMSANHWLDVGLGVTATVIPDRDLIGSWKEAWTVVGQVHLSFHLPESD